MNLRMFAEEPEPLDENDPDIAEELFETLKAMGASPDSLPDPNEAQAYADWLSKQ